MRRIKLSQRVLPNYTKGEETMNMVTHIVGGAIGIFALAVCTIKAVLGGNPSHIIAAVIYGFSMTALYAVSSVYHGLKCNTGKKIMQIIDHCAIYFLIAGTYTPILLCKFVPQYPIIGWSLLAAQWGLCFFATTLTAIDLRRYRVLSMICYIFMGWGIIFFLPQAISLLTLKGFCWILAGGLAYTLGAILFGIGVKIHWMHSVFHIFVVIGSVLQMIGIIQYVI